MDRVQLLTSSLPVISLAELETRPSGGKKGRTCQRNESHPIIPPEELTVTAALGDASTPEAQRNSQHRQYSDNGEVGLDPTRAEVACTAGLQVLGLPLGETAHGDYGLNIND